ncbi:MAG: hypothetical protein Q9165_002149 [Trypethelium subeluteriae]
MGTLFTSLCLLLFLPNAYTLVLKPVKPTIGDGTSIKRAALSNLELQNATDFYWGASGDSDALLANFTVYTPDDDEGILPMETFSDLLSSVECNDTSVQLTFKDDESFHDAQDAWDWVNTHDNRSFVLVAGPGDCGLNADREPFQVDNIAYNVPEKTVSLSGNAQNWTSAAHTYNLHVGHISTQTPAVSRRADYSKDWTVDFNHELSNGSISLSKGGFSIGLESDGSGTTGEFDFELDVQTSWLELKAFTAKLQPKGVSATAKLSLAVSGDLPDTDFSKSVTILSIPLDGIEIPGGILDIGPNLDIDLGITVGPLSGSAGVTGGMTVSISDNALLELDLLDSSNNQFSGWTPSVDILPWQANATVSGSVEVFTQPNLNLKAEILEHGYEIGLDLKMPYVNATLEAIVSTTGACPSNPSPHHQDGVELDSSIGAQFLVQANKVNDDGDPLFKVDLADYNHPFPSVCFDFGPTVTSGGSSTATSTLSSASATLTLNSTSATLTLNSTSVFSTPTGSASVLPTNGTSTIWTPTGSASVLPVNGTSTFSTSTGSVPALPTNGTGTIVITPTALPLGLPTASIYRRAVNDDIGYAKKARRAGFGHYGDVLDI